MWETYKERIVSNLKVGTLINADINGALNILRKVIGDSFMKIFDRGLADTPLKINPLGDSSKIYKRFVRCIIPQRDYI
jgi:hypothetical protein